MKSKKEYKLVLEKGFTPSLDLLTECYPKNCDTLFGKIFRYCQSSPLDCCYATRERLSNESGIGISTFNRVIKFLENQGLIIDTTPTTRNHPHTYKIGFKRLFEEIDLYKNSKTNESYTLEII